MTGLMRAAQDVVGRWPRGYVALMHLKYRRHPYRSRVVGPATAITIEGFPRSGTSFANRAFASSQVRPVRIATHAHHAAHVRRSAQLGIPTLVVVRDPAKCIPSHHALREEMRRDDPGLPPLDIGVALGRYAAFHREVLTVADSILLVRFEEVVSDYGRVIDRLNERFGQRFDRFEHTADNVQRLFDQEKAHLSPSARRRADNEAGVALYLQSPVGLRDRAVDAYRRTVAVADAQGGRVK